MPIDPAVDEIRRIRHEISEEVGHDVRRMKAALELFESQFPKPALDYGGERAKSNVGTT